MNNVKVPNIPDLPSAAIRAALDDLEKCERDEQYVIYMNSWHTPSNVPDTCEVCLAGAMIAQAGNDVHRDIAPIAFDLPIKRKLMALNHSRHGCVSNGCWNFSHRRTRVRDRSITPYDIDASTFKAQMRTLADDLEKEGN